MMYKYSSRQHSILIDCVKYVINLIKKTNRDITASVSVHYTSGISLSVRSSIINTIEFNDDVTLSITIFDNFKKITVSSKNLSALSLQSIVDSAINIVQYVSSDEGHRLPNVNLLTSKVKDLKLYHPCNMSLTEVIKLTTDLEKIALNSDVRIFNTEGSLFSSHINLIIIGNTYDFINSYLTTLHSLSISVIASNKDSTESMERDCDYSIVREFNKLDNISSIGLTASKKAISRLNSKTLLTQKMSLLLSPELSANFFSYFASAIHAANVYKKNTFLLNYLEKKIFPSWLSIVDDPHIEKGLGSKPFDLEGVQTKKCVIVDKGVLKTWLVDTYFGYKLGFISSGHSGGFHNWLIVGQSNLNLNDLLRYMYTGVYITELMGDGVNLMTGTCSFGAVGFLVNCGKIQYPINKITISGNLKDMGKNIIVIGNNIDLRQKIRCGSMLLSNVQISGQ